MGSDAPFEKDAKLEILTSKDPEALQVYRHSTAHLLAAAVLELFPETKLGIGPPTDTGFYYDFQRETPFTPEDLEKIEKRMWELQAKDLPYERVMTPEEGGLEKYADDWMKNELIEETRRRNLLRIHAGPAFHRLLPRPARAVHLADQGVQAALDRRRLLEGRRAQSAACSASTAPRFSARRIRTSTSQRLEEAKKRDHRKLGQELDLFSIQELAGPGLIFFHPKGGTHPQDHRRLDARSIPGARLLAGLHAARDAARSVEDFRPRQFL